MGRRWRRHEYSRWQFIEVDGIGINMGLVTQVLVADEGDMVTLWMVGDGRPVLLVGEAAVRFRKWWEKKAEVYRC